MVEILEIFKMSLNILPSLHKTLTRIAVQLIYLRRW